MTQDEAFAFFTPSEVAFVDAALARLIPADDLGPGAREAGVAAFIDGQLASAWGEHARQYRRGPWSPGVPEQGWQSPLAPREVYRSGIGQTDAHCTAVRGAPFAQLPHDAQDEVLHALEAGTLCVPPLPGAPFFDLLWRNTQEGFFADPRHGGNRGKIGWRLVGFPGVAAGDYATRTADFGMPYRVEPVSIDDVTHGLVEVDAQGAPRPRARRVSPA